MDKKQAKRTRGFWFLVVLAPCIASESWITPCGGDKDTYHY